MSDTTVTLLEAAETAVTEYEGIEPGEPGGVEAVAVAAGAVAELREYAAATIFPPTVEPSTADTIASYEFHVRSFPQLGFGQQLAALHGRCIDTHPALAAFVRGPTVISEVSDRAAASATVLARKPAELAAEEVAAYQEAVATCLHSRGELEPASGILSDGVPALQSRIDTVQTRHNEYAQAEKEGQEQELVARRVDLIERLQKIPPNMGQYRFVVPGLLDKLLAERLARFLVSGRGDEHLEEIERQLASVETFRGVPA